MELVALLEFLAGITGFLMSIAYFPQAWKIFNNKSAEDVSIISYVIFSIGTWIWLLWGLLSNSFTVIVGFAFGALGSTLVLALSSYYRFVKPPLHRLCKPNSKPHARKH